MSTVEVSVDIFFLKQTEDKQTASVIFKAQGSSFDNRKKEIT
jgi:hypothetical protein